MAGVSISHLILFISSLLIATAVAGTLVGGVDQISSSVSDQTADASESIRTDIDIISDAGSDAIVDGTAVTILVKNTGSISLVPDPAQVDILLNGQYVDREAITIASVNGDSTWGVGEVVEITIETETNDLEIQADSNRVIVIVNGNEALMRFRG